MTVHLVGAGPGDPELLTVKAARLLAAADVVVHDRLVLPAILDLAPPTAIRIDVGKDPDGRRVDQETINRILIEHGRQYETVVRLKGGDPFVFGRGGEEALDLAAVGIPVTVVPGVTSAIAGPAVAGIPLTQRGVSSGFTVVTAHQQDDAARPIDWHALAALGTTLVILMGARRAAAVGARLIEAGLAPTTPTAVIGSATTAAETVTTGRLAALGAEPIANPAIIVVGDVAAASVLLPRPVPIAA